MITLDMSAIIALLDRRDPDHGAVTRILREEPPPYLVPATVLGEVGYFIESRLGQPMLRAFLGDLAEGSFALVCGEDDLARTKEVVSRYEDLALGLVDAAAIACAERNGLRNLTLDQRDFGMVGREVPLTLLP